MLIPYFELDQDSECVILKIRIPNLKFNNKSLEISINNQILIVYLNPYYLRLKFNENLLNEDDLPDIDIDGTEIIKRRHIYYDVDKELLVIRLPKEIQSQNFTDLDFTHKLMSNAIEVKIPNGKTNGKHVGDQKTRLIEEIDIKDPSLTTNDIKEYIENYEKNTSTEFSWQFKQEISTDNASSTKYGFNNLYDTLVGNSLVDGGNDINELTNPEVLNENERIIERQVQQNYKFDEDIYISNYLLEKYGALTEDNYEYCILKAAIDFKNPTKLKFVKWQSLNSDSSIPSFTYSKEVKKLMIDLPKASKTYDDVNIDEVYYLIVSMIYSYNLNLRMNNGEVNVDSAWLIGKIMPQIAYLDNKIVESDKDIKTRTDSTSDNVEDPLFTAISTKYTSVEKRTNETIKPRLTNLKPLLIALIKRSLIYPLFRNFLIIKKTLEDTYYCLRFGFKKVIELLFTVRELFRKHSSYYIYNIIWYNDLLNYLIKNINNKDFNHNNLRYLSHEFNIIVNGIQKGDISFEKLNIEEGDTKGEDDQMLDYMDLLQLELIAEELYTDSKINN